ncbi:MAG: DUF4199 family protein [Saprospiraceae bacterium]|nr:DUF4199 family protein [Saprospiraceae bacterium]
MKYGSIGTLVLFLLLLLQRFLFGYGTSSGFSAATFMGIAVSFFNFVAYVVMMVLAIEAYKKLNEGYASMGKAFGVTFLTGLFMAIAFAAASLLFFLIFGFTTSSSTFMEGGSDIFDGSKIALVTIVATLGGLFTGSMAGAVIALIVSLVTKKERPVGFFVD